MPPPMKFATKIVALQHRAWSDYYLDYNGLKRILAELPETNDKSAQQQQQQQEEEQVSLLSKKSFDDGAATSAKFLEELDRQVKKITLFVLKEQGQIADDLCICQGEFERLQDADADAERFRALREMYNRVGADLLHLIQFVDLNVKGILRVLKKHDKRASKPVYDTFTRGNNKSATMMRPLLHEETLDALCVTLQTAYTELRLLQHKLFGTTITASGRHITTNVQQDLERGRSSDITKSTTRSRSPKGLGRRYTSIQGLDRFAKDHGQEFALLMEKDRRLTQDQEPSSKASVHDEFNQDDFIMAQIYAARRNLKQHDQVLNMIATTALGFPTVPPEIILPGQEDKIQAEYQRAAALAAYKKKSAISGMLNYVSSFIYMANYLIVVPTVVTYSTKLGADPALSSGIVGMTPFATIFSTIVYSWWTSYSYRLPLMFAASLNVVGNFIYAMGYPCNSMAFVLIGRLMSGLGSCRPINRRYIADAYSTADRTAASAHFVAVGSFGMALGPFLGSVLHRIAKHSQSPYWQVENAPGWFMGCVWLVYLVFHVCFFVDPPRDEKEQEQPKTVAKASNGEKKPLLDEGDSRSTASDERKTPLSAAVMVNFFIYFIEKLLMECVSSSTSILTYYYFDWPGSWAGYYLSFLCLLILPVNLLVAYLSKVYEDRQMMLVMQAATIVGCVVVLRYGPVYYLDQYLIGTTFIVVFSNMVEGPNMSLLSKTIPKSWRRGFLNVGLLATEAATLGRTVGDAYLALCGAGGLENQLNYTFGSMTVICSFTLWISYRYYDVLIPTEDKDL